MTSWYWYWHQCLSVLLVGCENHVYDYFLWLRYTINRSSWKYIRYIVLIITHCQVFYIKRCVIEKSPTLRRYSQRCYFSRHHISHWYSGPAPWWRHQMETFSELLALRAGNSPVTGEFRSQRPVTRNWCFLWFTSEYTTVRLVIWYAIALIMTSL